MTVHRDEQDRLYQEIRLVRECHVSPLPSPLSTAAEFAHYIRPRFKGCYRERFIVVPMDARHRPLGIFLVSIGSVSTSIVHPREVFLSAVVCQASAIVVAHNHPSGDPSPSSEDEAVTARLKEAGSILGITMLDHLVLGTSRYYSFADGCTSKYPEEENWEVLDENF